MLSYRHGFHAGNTADTLKHGILSRILVRLGEKAKPFSYLESHAGGGVYDLDAEWAQKTGEARTGILTLLERSDAPPALEHYLGLCRKYLDNGHRYPGSPAIARDLSREADQLVLMELHPAEIIRLRTTMGGPRVHIHHRDGYEGLLSLCPPTPRRGMAMIDPSYETDEDWRRAPEALLAINRRWPVGILTLWYPLIGRRTGEIRAMKESITASITSGVLCAELRGGKRDVLPGTRDEGFGLEGSGMIVVNPPWKLEEDLGEILPWLAEGLFPAGTGCWSVNWLTDDKTV